MSPLRILLPRGNAVAASLQSQWRNPGDILSLLLLIGGDVVRCALAQQTGDFLPAPVVFSFGWVAYAFTAVLSAVSNDQLMPAAPDFSIVVSSTEYGHPRPNQSWILGRLVRDYEKYWMPDAAKLELERVLEAANSPKAGLCVSVFESASNAKAGVPKRDFYSYSGYGVALVQLGIAVVPWAIWREYGIFVVTAAGTALAVGMGSLPRWKAERWNCRRHTLKNFFLTRGNGAQHAIVILGEGRGLDLEDLASSTELAGPLAATKGITVVLLAFWVVLLVTVSGIKEHTWFLVAVGTLGMLHTIVISGAPRRPEWFGIHLRYREVFIKRRVIETLRAVDEKYPGVGKSMLTTFFPNGVRGRDAEWAYGIRRATSQSPKPSTPKLSTVDKLSVPHGHEARTKIFVDEKPLSAPQSHSATE